MIHSQRPTACVCITSSFTSQHFFWEDTPPLMTLLWIGFGLTAAGLLLIYRLNFLVQIMAAPRSYPPLHISSPCFIRRSYYYSCFLSNAHFTPRIVTSYNFQQFWGLLFELKLFTTWFIKAITLHTVFCSFTWCSIDVVYCCDNTQFWLNA